MMLRQAQHDERLIVALGYMRVSTTCLSENNERYHNFNYKKELN